MSDIVPILRIPYNRAAPTADTKLPGWAFQLMDEAAAEIERLRAALEPFSAAASLFENDPDDRVVSLGRWYEHGALPTPGTFGADIKYTVSDVRRARAALSPSRPEGQT